MKQLPSLQISSTDDINKYCDYWVARQLVDLFVCPQLSTNRRFCASVAGRKSARLIASISKGYRPMTFNRNYLNTIFFTLNWHYGISADGFQIPHLRKAVTVSGNSIGDYLTFHHFDN